MPRNAAKRLNNEETRLPTSTTTTTNINSNYKVRRNNNKTQVTVTSSVQQQQQQQQQTQTHDISDITQAATTVTTNRGNSKFDLPRVNTALEKERFLIKFIQKQHSAKELQVKKEETCNLTEARAKQQVPEQKKKETAATAAINAVQTVDSKSKAPQKQQKGRRRNWQKGRYQIKSTKRATKTNLTNSCSSASSSSNNSSSNCCCFCGGNISAEAQTAAGANKNSQRGRECTVCGENVIKFNSSIQNNNNKTADNLGTNSTTKDDDAASDDDNDVNLANKSYIELITAAEITIKPTNLLESDATTSEQQKTIRLLSLRQRKREDDCKRNNSGNIKRKQKNKKIPFNMHIQHT